MNGREKLWRKRGETKFMNSPIKWVGGKRNIKKTLVKMLHEHMQYVEVFGGAGWVLLEKEKSKLEIFNDINGDLINFYKVVKDKEKCEILINELKLTLKSRQLFEEWDSLTKVELEKLNEIERAARFYFMLKMAFGGRVNRKKNTFCISNDGRKQLNYDNIPKEFLLLHERLQNVFIERKDFEYILKKYDRKDGDVVFYLDPPYLETTEDDYGISFSLDTYKRLKQSLDNVKGKWILTCNDRKELRELFEDYRISDHEVHWSICAKGENMKKYGELIISNYEVMA